MLKRLQANIAASPARWVTFFVALVVCQLVYWSFHGFISRLADIPIDNIIREYEVAVIDRPELLLGRDAELESIKSGWKKTVDMPGYIYIRGTFELDSAPHDALGLGTSIRADNHHVYINGEPVFTPGKLYPRATYHGQLRKIIRIPPSSLQAGSNEIEFLLASNAMELMGVNASIIGDYDGIMEATKVRRFFYKEYRQLTIVIAGCIAIITLFTLPLARNRLIFLGIFLIAGFTAVRTGYFFIYDAFPNELIRLYTYFLATLGIPSAWLFYAASWRGWRTRQFLSVAFGGFVASNLLILGLLLIDLTEGFNHAEHVTNYHLAIMGLLAAGLIISGLLREESSPLESAVLVSALGAVLFDAWGFIVMQSDLAHQRIAAPFLLLALIGTILARNVRIYDSLTQFNVELEDRLTRKEAELEAQAADLREAQKSRDMAEERQRILRDIHDGFGTQLTGLLATLKRKSVDQNRIRQSLSSALLNMRLMVDALDSPGDDLAIALGVFRHRIQPMLDGANIELRWDSKDLTIGFEMHPQSVLHIFRVLQEAVSNAVFHKATEYVDIAVSMNADDTGHICDISIQNNVSGDVANAPHGKGKLYMETRARQIGATLIIRTQNDIHSVILSGIRPQKQSIADTN